MIFTALPMPGAYVIDLKQKNDERGFFARAWCADEFVSHGLNPRLVQCNISSNTRRGTLRGMHYQVEPYPEAKLVRCSMGAVYDVLIDLRPASSTYKQWASVELTAQNHRSVYIPEGCAHGFQSLTDGTEVFYQMSEFYHPECGRGVRWDDPAFGIVWPVLPPIISARDISFELL